MNTFLGLDDAVNVRHESGSLTAFHVSHDEANAEYGEIIFGPDIYPGAGIIDPNSALSLDAAAAHELAHYYRWKDKVALTDRALEHVDEALTSLQAALRYEKHLSETDIRQLVSDAMQRLQIYVQEITPTASGGDHQ